MQLSNCRNIFLMKFPNFFCYSWISFWSIIHRYISKWFNLSPKSFCLSHSLIESRMNCSRILWTENHCGVFHWSLYGRFWRKVGYTCIIFHNRFNRWLKWNLMHRNEYETVFVFCCCCFNDGWLCIIFHTNNASHAMYSTAIKSERQTFVPPLIEKPYSHSNEFGRSLLLSHTIMSKRCIKVCMCVCVYPLNVRCRQVFCISFVNMVPGECSRQIHKILHLITYSAAVFPFMKPETTATKTMTKKK